MPSLPFLLAGPILRRVEARLVTVWVACSEPASVQLSVWSQAVDAGGGTGLVPTTPAPTYTSSPAPLTKLGDKLFLTAATLEIPATQAPLNPVTVYAYNVTFTTASGPKDLKSLGLLTTSQQPRPTVPLGYENGFLPTFTLCATTLEKVSVAHGSCRKPHGDGRDGLAMLDHVVADFMAKQEPLKRPQQLFLTGDQIYADDVAAALLRTLNPLANELIGKPETVMIKAIVPVLATEVTLASLPPFSRQKLLTEQAKFTSGEAGSHLISFGEFCAMYLLAWSNSAWPDELMALTVPTPNDALPFIDDYALDANLASFLTDLPEQAEQRKKQIAAWRTKYRHEVEQLIGFRDSLPYARRVLANIPSYMILDDHEVTDDLYLTQRWRQQVLTNPLGVSILRNGLLAYALFQDWGNNPKDYLDKADNPSQKKRLLALIPALYDKTNSVLPKAGAELDEVHELLGFAANDLDLGFSTDEAPPIQWHYRVATGPAITLVLETRTRRGYQRPLSPPALLSEGAFKDQLPTPASVQHPDAIMVVSAAPVLGLAALEELLQPLYWGAAEGRSGPDFEAWAFNPAAFEQLLAKLAPFKRVVLLSGDVHFGSSVVLDYWKKADAPATTYTSSRIVQLVASAFKNEAEMLPMGFFVSGRINQLESSLLFPGRRLGWQELPTVNGPLTSRNKIRLRRSPVVLTPGKSWAAGTTINPPPDWAWQCAPVMDERPEDSRPEKVRLDKLASDNLMANPQDFYEKVLKRHMAAFKKFDSRRYVWLNNLGIVAFIGSVAANNLRVEHTLWHYLASDNGLAKPGAYTLYSLSLIPTTASRPTIP